MECRVTQLSPLQRLWLTETVRLREEHAGPLDDLEANRRARATAGDLPTRLQNRALWLAERDGLLAAMQHWLQGARLALLVLAALADPTSGYTAFVATGNQEITAPDGPLIHPAKMPQMPTYHLKRADGQGVTLVNIGVGPSNAKTATDHIAVLRPHAWMMVGHCAGLRASQSLGDFVLAHAYLREDHVLDDDLPLWVPIPALAEIQIALQDAVAEVTRLEGYELKRIMRTGTVATIDNRNWELRDQSGPVLRLSQSRAVALDMESATIAANGFRFRVPYGTLLCVSDKPLHGELKLPGMASDFYKTQVSRHLQIGIRAMEQLRDMPLERIHSRKLRSFEETAFL